MELRVGVKRHACFAYVAKSKARSKKKQVINLDQDVQVCGDIYMCVYIFFRHVLWTCGIPSLGMHLFSLCFFIVMPFGNVAYLLSVCIFYLFLYSPYP